MGRRILAWVLLAGFLLLLVNVIFIRYQWELSVAIYIMIAFGFVLYSSRARRMEIWKVRKMNARNSGDDDEDNKCDDTDKDLNCRGAYAFQYGTAKGSGV